MMLSRRRSRAEQSIGGDGHYGNTAIPVIRNQDIFSSRVNDQVTGARAGRRLLVEQRPTPVCGINRVSADSADRFPLEISNF